MKGKYMGPLKTMTLDLAENADDPFVSICIGHVNAEIFNKAHVAEGWSHSDDTNEDLDHEYWIPRAKSWSKSEKSNPKAQPVTVRYW